MCIDLEPLEGRGENGTPSLTVQKWRSLHNAKAMPPPYLLGRHDDVQLDLLKSKSTLYYPGVRDREQATMVSVVRDKDMPEHPWKCDCHMTEKDGKISGTRSLQTVLRLRSPP